MPVFSEGSRAVRPGNLSAHGHNARAPAARESEQQTSGERAIFILFVSLILKPSFRSVAQDDCKGFHTLTPQESLLLPVPLHADAG